MAKQIKRFQIRMTHTPMLQRAATLRSISSAKLIALALRNKIDQEHPYIPHLKEGALRTFW
ncbi:MAG: hypothetical protein RLZ75_948 [Pseudomonadota bacterium]|jgi:hypothetical protein